MSRQKVKTTKEAQDANIKALHDRKERDAKLNYRYSPCLMPGCGKATRWRLPTGVEPTPENIKKYEPQHCGSEECSKAFAEQAIQEKKDAVNKMV